MILYKWVFTTSISIVLEVNAHCRQSISVDVHLNVQIRANHKVEPLKRV